MNVIGLITVMCCLINEIKSTKGKLTMILMIMLIILYNTKLLVKTNITIIKNRIKIDQSVIQAREVISITYQLKELHRKLPMIIDVECLLAVKINVEFPRAMIVEFLRIARPINR